MKGGGNHHGHAFVYGLIGLFIGLLMWSFPAIPFLLGLWTGPVAKWVALASPSVMMLIIVASSMSVLPPKGSLLVGILLCPAVPILYGMVDWKLHGAATAARGGLNILQSLLLYRQVCDPMPIYTAPAVVVAVIAGGWLFGARPGAAREEFWVRWCRFWGRPTYDLVKTGEQGMATITQADDTDALAKIFTEGPVVLGERREPRPAYRPQWVFDARKVLNVKTLFGVDIDKIKAERRARAGK